MARHLSSDDRRTLEVVYLNERGREATADERDVLGRYRGWESVDLN